MRTRAIVFACLPVLIVALVAPAASPARVQWQSLGHNHHKKHKKKKCKKGKRTKKGKCKRKQQQPTAPVAGDRATLQPPGFKPLTSAQAAAQVRPDSWEPRPQNYTANHTMPSQAQLTAWRSHSEMPYASNVDGQYTGTTNEIIEWAAYKWGLDEDTMRATATVESWWDQDTLGDNGDSFGIFQVRRPYHCGFDLGPSHGDCSIVANSTAFTADYYGGIIRAYYDGKETWLNNPDVKIDNGALYAAGDIWGSIGAWFDGRWHTPADTSYVQKIQQRLAEKTWLQPYFVGQ